MTKKDREIANQEAMIKNRDKLIKDLEDKIVKLQRTISEVRVIANSNLYGTDGKAYLGRIKELVRPANQN